MRTRAYLHEDTMWNLISTKLAKEMGMEVTPIQANVGWNIPNLTNKSGNPVRADGTGVASIMRLGTDWKVVDWAVCSGLDTPVLLSKNTWEFLMDTRRGPPWWDYCKRADIHLSFLDIPENGQVTECCPKCTEEKRMRRFIAQRGKLSMANILSPVKTFDREVILAKGRESIKKKQSTAVTLEADLPGGWTVKASTERRENCSENDCQQLVIMAQGPTKPPDAPLGVGASGLISVKGITRNISDTDVRIFTDKHTLWQKPEEGYHKISILFLGGCCKYLGGLASDKCNNEDTGIEVGVSSTKGTSNEVLVGTGDPKVMKSRQGINIGF